jgi:hypothetical protein
MNTSLQQGEYQLGRYKVRYAKFSRLGWDNNGPWMRILVTNRRLIILPDDARDSQATAIIPRSNVGRVWNVCLGKRDGVILALTNGQLLYFFIDWSQGAKLVTDIREMLTPPLQPAITPRVPGKPYIN